MANVNPVDGIKYGFRLMGYLIAVFAIGFIVMAVGGAMVENDSPIVGGLISLVGFLTLFAGFAGVQYKIIADGVEKGVTAANGGSSGGITGGQARAQPQASQQGGRQQSARQQNARQQGGRQQGGRQQGGSRR